MISRPRRVDFPRFVVGSRVMLVSAKVCLLVNNERFNINHTPGGGSWQTPEELPSIAVVCAKRGSDNDIDVIRDWLLVDISLTYRHFMT